MVRDIQANGNRIESMDSELTIGLMAKSIRETISIINVREREQ